MPSYFFRLFALSAIQVVVAGATTEPLAPKVVIVDLANALILIPEFDLLARNVTTFILRGGRHLPDEREIDAVSSTSPLFYPPPSPIVAFASFSVQVAMQHEADGRETPDWLPIGYWPPYISRAEAFEPDDALRQPERHSERAAVQLVYTSEPQYAAALGAPRVLACDTATSDAWCSGALLGGASENTTTSTNGTCEDGSVLGTLVRRVDFGRVVTMRTASDIDRPPPEVSTADDLNVCLTGVQVVRTCSGQ
ncbi:hypothetical protein BD309DRAFT_994628 [Dichomitus squalens]|uniref:Uncharacterized protein n=1 Tax=Dichomitus squalens TaxID=114155 RepID=A0A4Q9PED5_9APHY|nr:hypothetical protein BD309DRAFT_994628 [Dichomitus squalens]TBU51432.1 hypothetical protein BD310DRAFT_953271 [Dichomitus squalens]